MTAALQSHCRAAISSISPGLIKKACIHPDMVKVEPPIVCDSDEQRSGGHDRVCKAVREQLLKIEQSDYRYEIVLLAAANSKFCMSLVPLPSPEPQVKE